MAVVVEFNQCTRVHKVYRIQWLFVKRFSKELQSPAQKAPVIYPADVYAALKQFAKEDGRSFHNLVIWILREYIKQRQAQGKEC